LKIFEEDQVSKWTINIKNKPGYFKEGQQEKGDCTISITKEDFLSFIQGHSTLSNHFLKGRMRVEGNMVSAMKLTSDLFSEKGSPYSHLILGWIGTGLMGKNMCKHLMNKYKFKEVYVYN